ncbi:DUF4442 domain-containing protein [Acinetobacter faecalis]|uniref:DUF4442 domain-containing protein n=1 Tax=Acinetobacter faecalis TaxID=2665161 RepID=A0A6L6GD15_9GAMM|nr:DUF4442 domain-containing protein [Acinetobacter faecalis]MDY6451233.1 DUF4442 domain-containing protein [Acinetobacter faecalis]MDY6457979.1 DUF4442 domain-containing protein [Acinetobacter faecalis]MDY6460263.1 DUF4442 domain-containing protein [Acinetobacter faecalis]MDY6461228.1 DUF4442 domain-containing protein [Acinetobacter faecalis]MDY6482989.1 DUF4442 domain-containing protein [Acinetobacter faecalis]
MTQTNRLSKLVKTTSKFPKRVRNALWSRAFGRVVPMVGTAKVQYLEMLPNKVVVQLANHKAMQNHIGQIHACAMALIAETATGFVTAMNVPDTAIVLIKSFKVDFKRPTKGAMTAVATLTAEQQQLMQSTDKGETLVAVSVTDESNEEPIQCEMLWAWVSKDQLKKN